MGLHCKNYAIGPAVKCHACDHKWRDQRGLYIFLIFTRDASFHQLFFNIAERSRSEMTRDGNFPAKAGKVTAIGILCSVLLGSFPFAYFLYGQEWQYYPFVFFGTLGIAWLIYDKVTDPYDYDRYP